MHVVEMRVMLTKLLKARKKCLQGTVQACLQARVSRGMFKESRFKISCVLHDKLHGACLNLARGTPPKDSPHVFSTKLRELLLPSHKRPRWKISIDAAAHASELFKLRKRAKCCAPPCKEGRAPLERPLMQTQQKKTSNPKP